MATSEELSNRYYEMSRKYMRQAMEEFEKGDWSQASEKAWGAVADSIKATAVSRGWNHKSHPLLEDIITQLSLEFGNPSLIALFDSAGALHVNFYEHRFNEHILMQRIQNCQALLRELEAIRDSPDRRYTPSTREQERILERLTRYNREIAADADLDIATLPPVEPEA